MFANLEIAKRLAGGFAILILMLAGLAGYTIFAAQGIYSTHVAGQRSENNAITAEHISRLVYEARMYMWMYVATKDPKRQERVLEVLKDIERESGQLMSASFEEELKDRARQMVQLAGEFRTVAENARKFIDTPMDDPDYKAARAKGASITTAIDSTASTLAKAHKEDAANHGTVIESHISSFTTLSVAAGVASLMAGLLLSWRISRSITVPLQDLGVAVVRLAQGDTALVVPCADRQDELGPLAKALESWRGGMIQAGHRHAEEQERVTAKEVRQRTIEVATLQFDARAVAILTKVKGAAEQLHQVAGTLSANAQQTTQQSSEAAEATDLARSNVATMASATAELSASIQEISRQVNQSTATVQAARAEAAAANAKIVGLAESVTRIGQVLTLINDVAGQTNLLALNATIEAARAGDAGKGFAVVAGEVKNLASQTAKATNDIADQIATIQAGTSSAVAAIGGIVETISHISDLSTAIASAVEEQGTATTEIARSVEEASQGTSRIASNISGVAHVAGETGISASRVYRAADDLLNESAFLEDEVTNFLASVRAE